MQELERQHGNVCRKGQRATERAIERKYVGLLTRVRVRVGWIRAVLDVELVYPRPRSILEFIRCCDAAPERESAVDFVDGAKNRSMR